MPVEETSGPDPLRATLDRTLDRLDEPLTVEMLAARAHMSPRTFARRFRATTGVTPHQWLLHAQRLLETTDQAVERVAHASGFGSAGAMRLHFQRTLGTSPRAYRRTFRVTNGWHERPGRAGWGQRRRSSVTTLPKIATSAGSSTISSRAGFSGRSTTLPRRRR